MASVPVDDLRAGGGPHALVPYNMPQRLVQAADAKRLAGEPRVQAQHQQPPTDSHLLIQRLEGLFDHLPVPVDSDAPVPQRIDVIHIDDLRRLEAGDQLSAVQRMQRQEALTQAQAVLEAILARRGGAPLPENTEEVQRLRKASRRSFFGRDVGADRPTARYHTLQPRDDAREFCAIILTRVARKLTLQSRPHPIVTPSECRTPAGR